MARMAQHCSLSASRDETLLLSVLCPLQCMALLCMACCAAVHSCFILLYCAPLLYCSLCLQDYERITGTAPKPAAPKAAADADAGADEAGAAAAKPAPFSLPSFSFEAPKLSLPEFKVGVGGWVGRPVGGCLGGTVGVWAHGNEAGQAEWQAKRSWGRPGRASN